jgi:hypothetical protein
VLLRFAGCCLRGWRPAGCSSSDRLFAGADLGFFAACVVDHNCDRIGSHSSRRRPDLVVAPPVGRVGHVSTRFRLGDVVTAPLHLTHASADPALAVDPVGAVGDCGGAVAWGAEVGWAVAVDWRVTVDEAVAAGGELTVDGGVAVASPVPLATGAPVTQVMEPLAARIGALMLVIVVVTVMT